MGVIKGQERSCAHHPHENSFFVVVLKLRGIDSVNSVFIPKCHSDRHTGCWSEWSFLDFRRTIDKYWRTQPWHPTELTLIPKALLNSCVETGLSPDMRKYI